MIAAGSSISSEDVARHYDELDAFYRELWGEHVHHGLWLTGDETPQQAAEQLVARVAQAAAVQPGDAVCDVGCGYGATARWLVAERQAQVTGLTVSAHQHRYAKAQPAPDGPPVRYLLQDWLQAALPAQSFDAALFVESLAHMADKPQALRAAHRVLRPGGRLAACVWLAAPRAAPWMHRFLLEPICREGQLPGLPTMHDYRHMLAAAGFEAIRAENLSRAVRRTWTVVIRRVLRAVRTRPDVRRYLLDSGQSNRRFAWTLLRLWVAFRVGAFQYGLITARKPD